MNTNERFPKAVTADPILAELLPRGDWETNDADAKVEEILDDAVRQDTREREQRPRFKPWSYDEFKGMTPRQWRVGSKDKPLLIDKGLWATFGLYKSAKTFYSLDQAFTIGHGLEFLGHGTIQGNTAYLLAEGGVESAYERLKALCKKYEMDEAEALNSGKFNLITSAVNFTKPDAPDGLTELLRVLRRIEPRVVYLDTWMRMLSASGGHDSDPQTVGQALKACDRIIAELDCTVILCAHVGHNEQWRMKGMIDLEGAIDGATFCEKIGEGSLAEYHFKSVFQRHAEDGYEIVGALKTFGPSAALMLKATDAVKLSKLAEDYRPAYGKLRELFNLNTADGTLEGISLGAWRDAVNPATMWPDAANNGRDKWAKCKAAIEDIGLISISKDQVYLTA